MAPRRRSAQVKVDLPAKAMEPALPHTTSAGTRRTRRSLLMKSEIPDSDDNSTITISSPAPSRGSTVAVVVPSVNPKASAMKKAVTPRSASSIADSFDDSDDESRGLTETPDTSEAMTPAESIKGSLTRSTTKARITATARALELRADANALGSRIKKRRRFDEVDSSDLEDDTADARLARALQAEEYGESEVTATSSKRRKIFDEVEDSDDDLSEIEDIEMDGESSDDDDMYDDVPLVNRRSMAKRSTTRRTQRSKATPKQAAVSEDSELTELDSDFLESEFSMAEESSNLELDTNGVNGEAVEGGATLAKPHRERRKLERQHPEIVRMWEDLKAIEPIKPIAAEQPEGISRKLKSFQLEGLNWMTRQEKSQWKGGLLGDEMGMGKTIQAVSLIMSDFPAKDPTLVVVPPVALMQWQAEIHAYTNGKLQVLVYHGSNSKAKNLSKKDLMKYNVIMISYSGLESMYRKESKGWNRNSGLVKEDSVMHDIHFHRIILDEAHSIKQRTTGVARACFALKADYKWCLSGTPVQNRIGEFFSLLRFLELEPFSCYFCKACPCKQIHWTQDSSKMCTSCRHSGFSHVSVFNQEILNPITQGENLSLRKAGLDKLRLITDRIMLRRVKRDHTSSMELPPKEVIIHNQFFGEIERDFSSSIMSNTTRQFDTYVSRGVMLNNYANIFGLIMQMRQVSNHPDLILKKHAAGGQNVLVCCICDEVAEDAIKSRCKHEFCRQCAKHYFRSFEDVGDPDCPRCHIPLSIDLEQPEIEQEEETVKKSSIINRIRMEDWTSSTKIEMLVYDLYKLRSKKQTHKSIVFSQFTSMLQLVEWRLRRAGFNTVMLDGSMSPAQRQKSIEYFMNNVDVEVFLVSLKAGGVALNLTEASRVYIVDPWWNPAAEWQSADRCHRIGQRRPCVITRLCIEDSVESRIVLLQEKKANMINGTINNDQVALEKLTPEDMQFLFRGS
ncbi:putative dna excision repair protein [Phaeomoniella chlamydospora]|uniref:Putative dna excision repair protein n=1 Tax=Phaeomoniella chlamydospora TaxID=158046 RepID=A0A0G2G0C2_PHACM|nr:putative dna excision repair protein [Phaeomoniella chlamydospora]